MARLGAKSKLIASISPPSPIPKPLAVSLDRPQSLTFFIVKKTILSVFILLLFITFTLPTFGQRLYKVTSTELNIRIAPNKNSEVIGQLQSGEQVKVNSVENGWCNITMSDGRVGYVASKYLTEITSSTSNSNNTGEPTLWASLIMGVVAIVFLYYVASSWLKSLFSSTAKEESFRQKKPLKWFMCISCNKLTVKEKEPQQRANCKGRSTTHTWIELGEVGDKNFMCNNCGINILTTKQPFQRTHCPSEIGTHFWTEL